MPNYSYLEDESVLSDAHAQLTSAFPGQFVSITGATAALLRPTIGARTAVSDSAFDTTAWDQLWGFERGNALRPGVAANDSLENFWHTAFAIEEDATRLLDVACGYGALARYPDQTSRSENKSFEYLGVDSARINPPDVTKFEVLNPEFMSNKNIEDGSFQSGQFDLLISQFGFQYCQKDQVIELVSRWFRPGDRIILVVHSDTSAITLESQQILEQLRRL